jgi:hypothetical protein
MLLNIPPGLGLSSVGYGARLAGFQTEGFKRMSNLGMPNVMLVGDDQRHSAINALDALQNLLYLIRLDARKPAKVRAYADECDAMLSTMQRQMLPE